MAKIAKADHPPPSWLPAAVLERATMRDLAAGERLFSQGDKTFAIFEVQQGRLRLTRHTIDNQAVVLHTAHERDFLAEAALFADTYHCDAVAVVASRVRAYPKQHLLANLRGDPASAERFMAVLAHQIHALRARLEERNIRSARERIMHHLALAAGPDGRTVRRVGTLSDLAAEIGLTHEALYRTLAVLEKEGAITRTSTSIALHRRNDV